MVKSKPLFRYPGITTDSGEKEFLSQNSPKCIKIKFLLDGTGTVRVILLHNKKRMLHDCTKAGRNGYEYRL